MTRRRFALALAFAAVATSACSAFDRAGDALSPSAGATPSASITMATGSTSPGSHPAIVIETPAPGDELVSPIAISGRARTASGQVVVEILGSDGGELAASVIDLACGTRCRDTFSVDLAFFVEGRQEGMVRVFEPSAEDGTARNATDVAITLVPGV